MESTILEHDKTEESNVVTEEVVETKEEQPSKEETPEPVVELGEEKVPLSQVKKWKEDYANDSKWKEKNKRESEELNVRRKEIAQLELLKPYLDQRPEILQELISPSRNIQKEIESHFKNRPLAGENGYVDVNVYNQWEMRLLELNREQNLMEAKSAIQADTQKRDAEKHNYEEAQKAQDKYRGKVSEAEFQQMIQFIGENANFRNGKVPIGAFDVAFRTLFEDKYLEDVKLGLTEKIVKDFKNAKPAAGDNGLKQRKEAPTTQAEKDEEEFVKRMSERR